MLIGLDWVKPMMQLFLARHYSCTCHAYVPSLFFIFGTLLWWCFSVCLPFSLSLSRIVYAWHPSTNPLHLGTLFILGHLLLTPLLFTYDSVIRRPIRTSWRTSPDVVFIRSTTWFYWIFMILLYPLSFTVRDGNLYVRYPWVVPPWSSRSSTPTCTVSIPLYLSLLCRFKVHVWGLCPKTNFCLFSVRHLLHGMSAKTPHSQALQQV